MLVYYKDSATKKLAVTKVDGVEDHRDAILAVKEGLVANRVGYEGAVVALIQGGKDA
jgi:hypothetical protein